MTRKDFELIARVIGRVGDNTTRADLALRFADELRMTNIAFDEVRFLKACSVNERDLCNVERYIPGTLG